MGPLVVLVAAGTTVVVQVPYWQNPAFFVALSTLIGTITGLVIAIRGVVTAAEVKKTAAETNAVVKDVKVQTNGTATYFQNRISVLEGALAAQGVVIPANTSPSPNGAVPPGQQEVK